MLVPPTIHRHIEIVSFASSDGKRKAMTLAMQQAKTHAGARKLPMTEDVERCFRAIIEDRPLPPRRYTRYYEAHKQCAPLKGQKKAQ